LTQVPSPSQDKSELRRHYRAARAAIPPAERELRSRQIVDRVLALPEAKLAESWFVYLAVGSEVQTRPLIEALLNQGKTVAVPRILDQPGAMEAVRIDSLDALVPDRLGIPTPRPDATELLHATPDITIVPGLAFTESGIRLGQGGGYYDRYLAQHPETIPVGLCFTEQLADHLPTDPHDIFMHQVISG
jgi:5-formyltetrahydrofolate cyclo-ligase